MRERHREIEVTLPVGYMNVGVTPDGVLIADTNDGSEWDTIRFPLPAGSWRVASIDGKIVRLVREDIDLRRAARALVRAIDRFEGDPSGGFEPVSALADRVARELKGDG